MTPLYAAAIRYAEAVRDCHAAFSKVFEDDDTATYAAAVKANEAQDEALGALGAAAIAAWAEQSPAPDDIDTSEQPPEITTAVVAGSGVRPIVWYDGPPAIDTPGETRIERALDGAVWKPLSGDKVRVKGTSRFGTVVQLLWGDRIAVSITPTATWEGSARDVVIVGHDAIDTPGGSDSQIGEDH